MTTQHDEFRDWLLNWEMQLAQAMSQDKGEEYNLAYAHVSNIRLEFQKRFHEQLSSKD